MRTNIDSGGIRRFVVILDYILTRIHGLSNPPKHRKKCPALCRFGSSGLFYLSPGVLRQIAVLQQPLFILLLQYHMPRMHISLYRLIKRGFYNWLKAESFTEPPA